MRRVAGWIVATTLLASDTPDRRMHATGLKTRTADEIWTTAQRIRRRGGVGPYFAIDVPGHAGTTPFLIIPSILIRL